MVTKIKRWARHAVAGPWTVRRCFSKAALAAIEAAVAASEKQHGGEIRFAIEAGVPGAFALRGQPPRDRAIEVFSDLHVWDTEADNGVLIYVLLADRDVEILADRGLNGKVSDGEWEAVCKTMEAHFRAGDFEKGALEGIRLTAQLIGRHFPPCPRDANELPDRPTVL